MKLTKGEIDVIVHRLEVSDCIAECLTDVPEGETCEYTYEEVEEAAEQLLSSIPKTKTLPDNPTKLEVEILQDCVCYSNYADCYECYSDTYTRQKHAALIRQIDSATEKVNAWAKIKIKDNNYVIS